MNADSTHPTPEQAREQLVTSQARSLRSDRDRTVHAAGTVAFGLTLGAYMAARNVVSGATDIVASLLFFGVWLGATIWVERSTRTVPRRTKLWSRLGLLASMLVALLAVVPWLNLQAQTQPNSWSMVLVSALVIAAPSLLAATTIVRGRQ